MTAIQRFTTGRIVRVLVALGLTLAGSSTHAADATPEQIAQHIARLGSNRFAERERAAKALEAIGEPALPLLESAARGADPEVRRRAGQLLRSIQKRVESARLTAARTVRLAYRETPLAEAVADFNRKTGFAVVVEGNPKILKDRAVSLDAGTATLWQALDRFCRGAGLTEWRSLPETDRAALRPFIEARKKERGRLDFLPPGDRWAVRKAGEPLLLVPGKAPALPVCEAGGLRVRALPNGTPGWGQTVGTREVGCFLEIAPQPGLVWQETREVRIDRAVDDQGQQLCPVPPQPALPASAVVLAWRIAAMKSREAFASSARPAAQLTEIRLEVGAKPSHRLQRLEGVILGRAIAPPQTVLTVDRIFKATGETFRNGPTSLRVGRIKAMKDGLVLLEVEVRHTPDEIEAIAEIQTFPGNRFGPEDLRLQDAAGADYELVQGMANAEQANGPTLVTSLTVLYRASNRQGEPAKLVLRNRRPTFVEVPFCLENVPLP